MEDISKNEFLYFPAEIIHNRNNRDCTKQPPPMELRELTDASLLSSSVEPMVTLESTSPTIRDVTNDEDTSLHASPQNNNRSSHRIESPPHSLHHNSHRQRLLKGQTRSLIRANLHPNSPQSQQTGPSQQGNHLPHSLNGPFQNLQKISVLSGETSLQTCQSHQRHARQQQNHLNSSQYNHGYEQQNHQQNRHLRHTLHVNFGSSAKFNGNSEHSPEEVERPGNSRSGSNNKARLPSNSLSQNTRNNSSTLSVHRMPRIGADADVVQFQLPSCALISVQDTQHTHAELISKLEAEVVTLNQDIAYFRHVIDFQSLKIDKLTLLIIDVLHNKKVSSVALLPQNIPASDHFSVQDGADTADSMQELITPRDTVQSLVHDSIHDVETSMATIPSLASSVVDVPDGVVLLEEDIEPLIHEVAQSAIQAQTNSSNKKDSDRSRNHGYEKNSMKALQNRRKHLEHQSHQNRQNLQKMNHANHQRIQNLESHQNLQLSKLPSLVLLHASPALTTHENHRPLSLSPDDISQSHFEKTGESISQTLTKRKDSMSVETLTDLDVSRTGKSKRKRPKLSIDFLHNPMTVKEIYHEFTKGIQGQPPLRDLDRRFGRDQWRGDSRTKESKRFQRRRKLCDAIERGMAKYAKSAEEVIQYIEEFRSNKSLTWVMNGNLPKDLVD